MMITHRHRHHLDMGTVVLVVEDHTGIPVNHRIHQPILLRIGEVDGINPILHLHLPILCMGRLLIMVLHQTIRIPHHHLTLAHTTITMHPCMVATPRPIHLTTIEEVPLRQCQDLIIQVCRCTHTIWEGRHHPTRTGTPLGWKKKPY